MGIWLALLPLLVVRRKQKRRGFPWLALVCVGLFAVGALAGCGGRQQKAMDDFADQFCIDTATPPLPHRSLEEKTLGYPDVNGEGDKCEVIDACVRETGTLLEGIEGPSKGLPAFAKDVIIVFCLGKDTKAEDCEVLSWIQGYLRKKASGETAWDYGNNFFGYSPHVEQDHPGAGLDKTGAESGFPYPTDCNCPYEKIGFQDSSGLYTAILIMTSRINAQAINGIVTQ